MILDTNTEARPAFTPVAARTPTAGRVAIERSERAPRQTLSFHRRQALYHGGDPAQSVYRVRDGLVRIARMTPEGRVLTVRHVLPGDFFGEEAFMGGNREELAEALTSTQIEAIDPTLIDHGELITITRSLSHQMQRQMDYGYHLQTGDLRQRVARYLLKLADTPLARRDAHGRPMISATHELLAEGTASTRESVSKIITDLRAEGLITSGYRSITLVDGEELAAIAEGF
jgi:CRP/FNR family transcriptional regulator, LitR-dependent transcriptional activator